jgi:hypothetical protein
METQNALADDDMIHFTLSQPPSNPNYKRKHMAIDKEAPFRFSPFYRFKRQGKRKSHASL